MPKIREEERPNYYFILTAGRYFYDDSGENIDVEKFKLAILQHLDEIKPYTTDLTDDKIVEQTRDNQAYRFFNRAVLINICSENVGFDKERFEIVGYESFKLGS